MTTIGIDARLAGQKHAGIGRYIINLLLRLPLLDTETNWVYFFADKSQLAELMAALPTLPPTELKKVSVDNFFKKIKIVYAPIKHYSLEEQWQWPKILRQEKLDLLHVPHFNIPYFYRGQLIVTIHDLLWHEQRGHQVTTLAPVKYYLKYFFYKIITRRAVSRAQKVLVPTQTVAQTVAHYYPRQATKIEVTYEGFYRHPATKLSRSQQALMPPATQPFLLYVGSLYPHKNIKVVLKALATRKLNYHLVLVGARNVFVDQIKALVTELEIDELVHFLGPVSDGQLTTLYQAATFLVQPSLSEGFGLTGIEAMELGTPVVASDIPIFAEVYGQAALYFNPHQPLDLVRQLNQLTTTQAKALIEAGHQQAQLYSWQKMTSQTLAAYQEIMVHD